MMYLCDEVSDALSEGRPVVALESTVIAHGLPYPANRELALGMEADIRENGAVPATIAVLDGALHIGLDHDTIERLANAHDVLKLNASDVPLCIAAGKTGATTVSGTMLGAAKAGIRFFATGGMGGVHRGVESSFDISQDLTAFSKYPVAVVTAGAKAILDLPKTLEYLETLGVPVVGVETDEFPAFWTRTSGLKLNWSGSSPAEIARLAQSHWGMAPNTGLIFANPIPEADEIPETIIRAAIESALRDSEMDRITGKAVTPYLLQKVRAYLPKAGPSNVALLRHNAVTAAKIASAYCAIS